MGNFNPVDTYREPEKCLLVLLSRTQAGPGRAGKQEQGGNSQQRTSLLVPLCIKVVKAFINVPMLECALLTLRASSHKQPVQEQDALVLALLLFLLRSLVPVLRIGLFLSFCVGG